ncbi:MAG: ribonuclease HI [Pseudomonadota bacterium]|nr:ribonuclease HI [Pseudomonadota bacterium]
MPIDFAKTILIFTDGACSGNPGPGGFGSILVYPEGQVEELGASRAATTNNRMEIAAVIAGLQKVKSRPENLWVLTDSTYVIRGITQWIWGWQKKGWITAEGKEVSNKDLWQVMAHEVSLRKKANIGIEWKYLRGHVGTPGNERCDEIATSFSQKKYVDLFSGSLLKYPVSIHDLPEDMSLPPMKEKSEKKEAFSYLSYVSGKLARHKSWKECEAQVKGRSGAKFKKAMSAEDEVRIVESWGLSAEKLIDKVNKK